MNLLHFFSIGYWNLNFYILVTNLLKLYIFKDKNNYLSIINWMWIHLVKETNKLVFMGWAAMIFLGLAFAPNVSHAALHFEDWRRWRLGFRKSMQLNPNGDGWRCSSAPWGPHSGNSVMGWSEESHAIQVRFQVLEFPHLQSHIH